VYLEAKRSGHRNLVGSASDINIPSFRSDVNTKTPETLPILVSRTSVRTADWFRIIASDARNLSGVIRGDKAE